MLIQDEEDVKINRSNTQIYFETDTIQISSRVLAGQYPQTDRLIPTTYKTLVTVNKESFLASLERSRILAEDKIANFEISNKNAGIFETIQLTPRNSEVGSSVEEIIVESIEGEELNIAFSTDYVMEALKAIDSEMVLIEFSGAMRPFIIRPTDNRDYLQLVLPVRAF